MKVAMLDVSAYPTGMTVMYPRERKQIVRIRGCSPMQQNLGLFGEL